MPQYRESNPLEYQLDEMVDAVLVAGIGLFVQAVGNHHADGGGTMAQQTAQSSQG